MTARNPVALHVRESRLTPSASSDGPVSALSAEIAQHGARSSRQTALRGTAEEKKEAEKRTEAWQDWLMEQEKPVTVQELKVAVSRAHASNKAEESDFMSFRFMPLLCRSPNQSLYLQPEHFAEVAHERHLANRCGYPRCARPSRAPFRSFDEPGTSSSSPYDMPTSSSRSRYALDSTTRTFRRLVGGNHRQAYCSSPCEARARWYTLQLDSQAGGRSEPLRWRAWWMSTGPGEAAGREMSQRVQWDPATAQKAGWAVPASAQPSAQRPSTSARSASGPPSAPANDPERSAAKLHWLERTHGRFARWQAELLEELEARDEVHVDSKTGEVRPGRGSTEADDSSSRQEKHEDAAGELKSSKDELQEPVTAVGGASPRSTATSVGGRSAAADGTTPSPVAASRRARPAAKLATSDIIQGEAGSLARVKGAGKNAQDPKVLAATLSSLRIVERPPAALADQDPQPPSILTSKALQDPVAARVAMQPQSVPPLSSSGTRRQSSHALAAREDARRRYLTSAGSPAGAIDGEDDGIGASTSDVSRQVVQASTRAAAQAPATQPSVEDNATDDGDDEDDDESDEDVRAAFEMAAIARQQLKDGTFE